jgi:hypothetical protein
MRKRLPEAYRELMKWLDDQVFVQEPSEEQLRIDEEQRAFDEDFDLDLEAAVKARWATRDELAEIMHQS